MAKTLVDAINGRLGLPAIGNLADQIQDAVLRQDLDWVTDQFAGRAMPPPPRVEPDRPIPIIPGLPGQ